MTGNGTQEPTKRVVHVTLHKMTKQPRFTLARQLVGSRAAYAHLLHAMA